MVGYHIEKLAVPTDTQVEEIVQLCIKAFDGDVSMNAMLGGDWSLAEEYFRAATLATALEGELYVVILEEDSKIVSISSWFAPGKGLFDSEKQRELGFNKIFKKLSPELQYWWHHTYPETITPIVDDVLFTQEEKARRWWCFNLASLPAYNNRGFAKAMINMMFQRAKDNNLILGLATSPEINVNKYISMGFHQRGKPTDFPAPTGNFPVHVLSREP